MAKEQVINYKEEQRKRALAIRDSIMRDPGDGVFLGKQREKRELKLR